MCVGCLTKRPAFLDSIFYIFFSVKGGGRKKKFRDIKRPTRAHMKTCPDCNGDGVVDKDTDNERRCPMCGGSGFVPDDDDDHEEVIKTEHQREAFRAGP